MKGADSVRQPVQAFFQSASWLPQAPHQDGLKSLHERDSFFLWSLLSGILLHSRKVLTNSTSHCMNTRKMEKAVQAARLGEGRDEKTESGPGAVGLLVLPLIFLERVQLTLQTAPPHLSEAQVILLSLPHKWQDSRHRPLCPAYALVSLGI